MKRRHAVVLGLVVAVAAAWALGRPHPPARKPGQSVLLVTIDTLRADALGSYGGAGAWSPVLDALASKGVRFEKARAHNVVTLPSHANILSGRYPYEHGVRDNAGYRFPADMDTLATLLRGAGYRTGAFVSAFPLDSRFGLDRGFDVYDDALGDPERLPAFRMGERKAAATIANARAFMDARDGRPFFCWIHLYEPHAPYEPAEPFASRFAGSPYRGEVAAVDEALRPLLQPLVEAGTAGNTLAIVTSDHGESLGEHGEKTHGVFAYEATLRVPLVLFDPALFGARVVADPVRHVDVLPTVLDALGLAVPRDLPGRSLLGLAAGGREAPVASYFEALTAAANRGWAPLHGVVRDEHKYIRLPIPELYGLRDDPGETRNVAATQASRLDGLVAFLDRLPLADAAASRQPVSGETRARLQSLGYVTAAAPRKERYTDADDPKALIQYEGRLEEAVERQAAGDLEGALALGRELVRAQPDSPLVLLHVATLEREAGRMDAAAALLGHARSLAPADPQVAALLGRTLVEAGRADEAVAALRDLPAGADGDADVLMARGAALAATGRTREALATMEGARALDPSNGLAWLNVGTVHLMAGRLPEARTAFRGALDREPALARAHTSLGVVNAREGDAEAAIAEWKQAVALNAGEVDALYNLGVLLRKEGRSSEARPYLERFVRDAPAPQYARDVALVRRWLAEGGSLG